MTDILRDNNSKALTSVGGEVAEGLFRAGVWVLVRYSGTEPIPIPLRNYQVAGYKPPFGDLPIMEESDLLRFPGDENEAK